MSTAKKCDICNTFYTPKLGYVTVDYHVVCNPPKGRKRDADEEWSDTYSDINLCGHCSRLFRKFIKAAA